MKNKRVGGGGGRVLTRSSSKKQKAGTTNGGSPISAPLPPPTGSGNLRPENPSVDEEFGTSLDSGQGVWTELSEAVASNLADTVVSIASFDEGNSVFFACTGIIIENVPNNTSFLTSLSLVRSIQDDSKIFHEMKIEVRLPDNHVAPGWLNNYDLQHNLAVIRIPNFRPLRVLCLDNQRQFDCHSKVVSLGRCFNSGKLMATAGMLTDNPGGAYRQALAISTCVISMTGVGGPLVDFNGDFIGMNFYAKEETPFLPKNKILELLTQFRKIIPCCAKKVVRFPIPRKSDSQGSSTGGQKKKQKPSICTLCDPECQPGLKDRMLKDRSSNGHRWPNYCYNGYAEKQKLKSYGYPFPLWEDTGRRLVNSFEQEFNGDILSTLKKKVFSNISESVVALASFNGTNRCFTCTGTVIESNESTTRVLTSASLVLTSDEESKVLDNLKIVVCLPDNRTIRGTLQHYSLNYNIAIVSIADFRFTQTAWIDDQVQIKPHAEVVAVGRVYDSSKLMATSGAVTDKPSELNCKELVVSTCKISKAGIGGPLIDFDGNFVGMNFYGLEETPYIPTNIILELLRNFDARGTTAAVSDDDSLNRWPVPKPFWCYPTWHDSEEKINMEEFLAELNVRF